MLHRKAQNYTIWKKVCHFPQKKKNHVAPRILYCSSLLFSSLLIPETYQEDPREWLVFQVCFLVILKHSSMGSTWVCGSLLVRPLPKCLTQSVLLLLSSGEIQVSRRNLKTTTTTKTPGLAPRTLRAESQSGLSYKNQTIHLLAFRFGLPAKREQEACLWVQDYGMQTPKQLFAVVLSFVLEGKNNVSSLLSNILVNKYQTST